MIIGRNIESIWAKHRKEFLAIYASELVKKVGAKDLTHRYTDSDGVAYYGFSNDMAMPVERLGKTIAFSELLFKGMSAEEDEKIDKRIIEQLEIGLSNPKEKSAAKIGSLIMERQKRRGMIIHSEVILNLLAVQWVREDEDPAVYSNEIQLQKVDQFKKEIEKGGAYPFFQAPELKQLRSYLQLSKQELDRSWADSILKQMVLQKSLDEVYTLESASPKSKKTSTEV